MQIKWDEQDEEFYVNIPISAQTLHMAFQVVDESLDTIYFNIYMTLYNKRSQI